jgi:CheY-like chemotaxis protein
VLLIVEDDVTFARILVDLAHDRGIKALVALRGGTALPLAREFIPGAITLDITLPDMAGWTILDRLKHDPATRHIPVHVITGDENRRRGLALGAMTYLEKSVTKDNLNAAFDTIHHSLQRRTKKLLIVAPRSRADQLAGALGGSDVEIIAVGSGGEALAVVKQQYLDGIVLDLRLADIPAAQLVEEIQAEISPQTPPIVVCGPRRPGAEARADIRRLARQSVVRYAESLERLLEETRAAVAPRRSRSLRIATRDPARAAPQRFPGRQEGPGGGRRCAQHFRAHHGPGAAQPAGGSRREWPRGHRDAAQDAGVDGVLMDIMMPEMDGYETMRAIRQIPNSGRLPIIAVTAKAMKGDRAKCIEAGASDYITKPVDLDQLFSVLRVWLVRSHELAPAAMSVAG